MTLEEAKKRILSLEKRLKSAEEKLKTGSQVSFGGETGTLTDFATVLKNRFDELEQSIESLSKAGATFAKGGTLGTALSDSIKLLDEFPALNLILLLVDDFVGKVRIIFGR